MQKYADMGLAGTQRTQAFLALQFVIFLSLLLLPRAFAHSKEARSLLGIEPWEKAPYTVIKPREGMTALAIWQITHDWDMNEGCWKKNPWSANGRYVRFSSRPRRKDSPFPYLLGRACRVLYDLHLQRRRKVKAYHWQWAWRHNRAYIMAPRGFLRLGPLVKWDLDTEECAIVHPAFGRPFTVSHDDRYVFAKMTKDNGKHGPPTRLDTRTGKLKAFPYKLLSMNNCNPRYPVMSLQKVVYRLMPNGDKQFLANNGFLDLNGRFISACHHLTLRGHRSWGAGGDWYVIGDGPLYGRRWNAGFPANWECLSVFPVKDTQMCGLRRRYVVNYSNTRLHVADVRTGEDFPLNYTLSGMAFPRTVKGDHSGLYDVEAHGSPDGTKVYWSGTCDIANTQITWLTDWAIPGKTKALKVRSTEGFSDSGVVLVRSIFGVAYRRKTATSFEGITLGAGNTRIRECKKRWYLVPLSAINITDGKSFGRPRLRNSFITLFRHPDTPFLEKGPRGVTLYPGEYHQETRAYRFRLNQGKAVESDMKRPWAAAADGSLQVAAVEWCGLASKWSKPVRVTAGTRVTLSPERPPRLDAPRIIAYTLDGEKERPLSRGEVKRAPRRRWFERVINPQGEIIETREYAGADLVKRHIISERTGKLCKTEFYANGKLVKREHYNTEAPPLYVPDGQFFHRETYDADGWKTTDYHVLWKSKTTILFEKGVPIKKLVVKTGSSAPRVYKPKEKGWGWVRERSSK